MISKKVLRNGLFKNYLLSNTKEVLVGKKKQGNRDALTNIMRQNATHMTRMILHYKTSKISELANQEVNRGLLEEMKKTEKRFHKRKWKGCAKNDNGKIEKTEKQYKKPHKRSIQDFLQSSFKRLGEQLDFEATVTELNHKVFRDLKVVEKYHQENEIPVCIIDESDIPKSIHNGRTPKLAGLSIGYIGTKDKYPNKIGYRVPLIGSKCITSTGGSLLSLRQSQSTSKEDKNNALIQEIQRIQSISPVAPDFVVDNGFDSRENFALCLEKDISVQCRMTGNRNVFLENGEKILLETTITEILNNNEQDLYKALFDNIPLNKEATFRETNILFETRQEDLRRSEEKTLIKHKKFKALEDKRSVVYLSFSADLREEKTHKSIPIWISVKISPLRFLVYKTVYEQEMKQRQASIEKIKATKATIAEGKILLRDYEEEEKEENSNNSEAPEEDQEFSEEEKTSFGEYFIIGATKKRNRSIKSFDLYKKRWSIEVLFRTSKSKDIFDLKDFRLLKDQHLDVMLTFIQLIICFTALFTYDTGVIAICDAIQVGGSPDDKKSFYNETFRDVGFVLAPMLVHIFKIG